MRIGIGVLLVITVCLASNAAVAQERVRDAALGGLAGAVVLGPVGAAAGAVIGYTMGPSIERGLGINERKRRPVRSVKRSRSTIKQASAPAGTVSPRPRPGVNAGVSENVTPPAQTFE